MGPVLFAWVRNAVVRQVRNGGMRRRADSMGLERIGGYCQARFGRVWLAKVRMGLVWQVRHGLVGTGSMCCAMVGYGRAGTVSNQNKGETVMDVKAAVALISETIKQTGKTQATVIDELWKTLDLSPVDVERLAKTNGIRAMVGEYLTSGMTPSGMERMTFQLKQIKLPQEPMQFTLRYLRNTCFQVEDGSERKLLEFRIRDFEYCMQRNQTVINGLVRHNRAFEFGRDLLTQYKVTQVSKLPVEEQENFNVAWKRLTIDGETQPYGSGESETGAETNTGE